MTLSPRERADQLYIYLSWVPPDHAKDARALLPPGSLVLTAAEADQVLLALSARFLTPLTNGTSWTPPTICSHRP